MVHYQHHGSVAVLRLVAFLVSKKKILKLVDIEVFINVIETNDSEGSAEGITRCDEILLFFLYGENH